MDILILGGPKFLGRATIDAALAAGHNVTLFNRGQTNPDLYLHVEKLRGDRDGQLDALKGRTWDVVIDNCGFAPRIVRQSAELLTDHVGRYIFISAFSAYQDLNQSALDGVDRTLPGMHEDSPLVIPDDKTVEPVTFETYGGLKVLCERVVQEVYGERALIIRPGLIVGPHDPGQVLTFWVRRVAQGGDMYAPSSPNYPLQFVDVRDEAEWTIRLAEGGVGGVYNITGPDRRLTYGEVLETAREIAHSDANPVWVSDDLVVEQGVKPWREIPMWLPHVVGWTSVSIDKALAAGLTFRPLADTIQATLAWAQTHEPNPAHLTREREAEILEAWRVHSA